MFVDKARIYIRAGKGGDGCLSFRREKFVPYGGPDGGNGGKGGDVILRASASLGTLYDFQRHPHYRAGNGGHGQGKNKTGEKGKDIVLLIPCGTAVYKGSKLLVDLVSSGSEIVVIQGGRGGRGNRAFKSSRNPAPRIAEKGEPGEEAVIDLELKLIADVGIVGCPNAGKSTFLSKVTSARPKIAAYPFTTLSPNLGVTKFRKGHQFKDIIFADIPGLIEGAHLGKGLGDEFLRHIERTRLILHIVDVFGYDNKTAKENFYAVNHELRLHSPKLAKKPMIVAVNKMDLLGAKEKLKKLNSLKRKGYTIFPISALTGEGVNGLLNHLIHIISSLPPEISETEPVVHYIFEPDFRVEKREGIFYVTGKKVEHLVAMTNFTQPEAVERLQNILKKIGLEKALLAQGINNGDTVRIGKYEFTFTR